MVIGLKPIVREVTGSNPGRGNIPSRMYPSTKQLEIQYGTYMPSSGNLFRTRPHSVALNCAPSATSLVLQSAALLNDLSSVLYCCERYYSIFKCIVINYG